MSTNTSSPQQEANFLEEDDNASSDEEANNAIIPESHEQDTSTHYDSPPECKNLTPQGVRHYPRRRRTINEKTTRPS